MFSYAAFNGNSMPTIRLARLAAGLVHRKVGFCNNDDITLNFLVDEILVDCSQSHQSDKISSLPKFPAIRYAYVKTEQCNDKMMQQ